ncbi:MAG: alpha-L-rhamnosidase C-terminal domain-containing protein [Sphingobacterium composti]
MNLPENDKTNVWIGFAKEINVENVPKKALAKIAVDSKYWLYINGKLVVFEGGIKRGPNIRDTYYDEVDIAPYLKSGKNLIAIDLWHFGKQGFSHNDSGIPGLLFDLQTEELTVLSDSTWKATRISGFKTADKPFSNFRLPESSLLFDARVEDNRSMSLDKISSSMPRAIELGRAGSAPWNNLVKRSIPLWKDYGIKKIDKRDIIRVGDTIKCKLPYNMHFTPIIALKNTSSGQKIVLATDNYYHYNGGADIVRAEYITKQGKQYYESPGWMNGHYIYIVAPPAIEFDYIAYRETGYNTEFAGEFQCSDDFFNTLWQKSRRTLYVTMRDNFMDCPDRERALWTGDAVLESEESYYALDVSSHALSKKWLTEMFDWQREDGSLYSPIPSVIWDNELPGQVLATVGYYGVWTYYLHTGDRELIEMTYPRTQKYMNLWEFEDNGLVKFRKGGWTWGDWGENKDIPLLYNLWYYLALKSQFEIANELGLTKDKEELKFKMEKLKNAFNEVYWNNGQYRSLTYDGLTDDRVHALAVVSGVADEDKYEAIEKVFDTHYHASPYMEKYVFEAMYRMGLVEQANQRHKKRFDKMVNNKYFTTLFEGWGIGKEGFGGGTVNHAWSGGGLSVLHGYMAGVRPLKPAYEEFIVAPQVDGITDLKTLVPSIKGDIKLEIKNKGDEMLLNLSVPAKSTAHFKLPFQKGNYFIEAKSKAKKINTKLTEGQYIPLESGNWKIKITKKEGDI